MNVLVTQSYSESCKAVAQMIGTLVNEKPNCKLGLATGGTPVPIYQALVAAQLNFAQVRTVNLDEYCGIAGDHPQSYRYFMNTNLFDHINIDKANTFVASGLGDAAANAAELTAKVYEGGVPDLQLLGIGNNGHIAFNEAGETLSAHAHIEQLTPSTIEANARFFENEADVPTTSITMGMGEILAARQIVLVATGLAKVPALQGLLMCDAITTQNPSTLLKLHPNVTVVIDAELADAIGYQG